MIGPRESSGRPAEIVRQRRQTLESTESYALLYGRLVTDEERKVAKTFLGAGDEAEMWPRYAQALLSSYEFMQSR